MFTAEQARAEGWTARTVRRRIDARRWVYVAGRGLAEPSPRWTAFQLAMAARLTLGEVVVSHWTAAGLHGFPEREADAADPDDAGPECDVIIGAGFRPHRLRIRPHRIPLTEAEIQVGPCGILLTTPARTALDCLAVCPFGAALDLWAWLSTRRIIDLEGLQAAIGLRRGRPGTAQLKRLAELVADGAASQAEWRLHQLLRRAGITGWTANAQVGDGRGLIGVVDLLFAEVRLLVEVDGWGAHRFRSAFEDDRRRQNRLVAAGYTVLRFTWADLTDRPADVVAQIRRALTAA